MRNKLSFNASSSSVWKNRVTRFYFTLQDSSGSSINLMIISEYMEFELSFMSESCVTLSCVAAMHKFQNFSRTKERLSVILSSDTHLIAVGSKIGNIY